MQKKHGVSQQTQRKLGTSAQFRAMRLLPAVLPQATPAPSWVHVYRLYALALLHQTFVRTPKNVFKEHRIKGSTNWKCQCVCHTLGPGLGFHFSFLSLESQGSYGSSSNQDVFALRLDAVMESARLKIHLFSESRVVISQVSYAFHGYRKIR